MPMNEWEAKYKALAAGIDDEQLIVNAEKLVRTAIETSQSSVLPFGSVLEGMLRTVSVLRERPTGSALSALFGTKAGSAKVPGRVKAGNALKPDLPS